MKIEKEDNELIENAKEIIIKSRPVRLFDTGEAGCALVTNIGNIFYGVNVGFYCGIGSCAEYQAIGNMISHGEKEIKTIVAVYYNEKNKKYKIIPPCGKCREMISQACKKNKKTEIIISGDNKILLSELLPYPWEGSLEK